MDVERNPTSNVTCYHLTVVGLGEGGVGAPKKNVKNINETFDLFEVERKVFLTIWGGKLPCCTLTFEHWHKEIALSSLQR